MAKGKLLAKAKAAAVIVEAKRSIACGDGSPDGCIAVDFQATTVIEREVEESDLWRVLAKAEPKKADVLLKFTTRDQALLQLCAYDADTNEILWCDVRSSVALDNDASRELVHFLDTMREAQQNQ